MLQHSHLPHTQLNRSLLFPLYTHSNALTPPHSLLSLSLCKSYVHQIKRDEARTQLIMEQPPQKRSKGENGEAVPIVTDAVVPVASAATSTAATAASSVPKPLVSMRDDLLQLQLIKQGAEGVSQTMHCRWHIVIAI